MRTELITQNKIRIFFTILICNFYTMQVNAQFPEAPGPKAEKRPHWRTLHNDKVLDNYYWMYDYFGKGPDSSKVVDYLNGENEYLDTMMASTKLLQSKLFSEMKARIKEKDESVPVFKNGYFYYTRTEPGEQYFKYCRKKGSLSAKEEILLDVDSMAEGHAYYAVTGFDVTEDSKLLAFAVDVLSRRQYTIHVKNLETGEILTDVVSNTEGDPCWANDNKTFFYTEKHPVTLLSEKIKRHVLGTNASLDAVVYVEKDKSNYIGIEKTKNNKYICIYSEATLSSEVFMIKASEPTAAFKSFQPRIKDVIYQVISLDDRFLIRTNKDAVNFKLMECSLEKTGVEAWKDYIPHRVDVLLQEVDEFADFIIVNERKNGLVQLLVKNLKNKDSHYIDFEESAYSASLSANPEYNSKVFRFSYTSLTTPNSTFEYNIQTKSRQLLKQQEVLGAYDKNNYVTERLYVKAGDGAQIPVSLVYKKGFEKNGNSPLLLYAYGSYGSSTDARFTSTRLSLLDRGFVFAIAHIRGGQEMGRLWYENGKMFKKKNTFTDFIDCANFLVDKKYTSSKHLYAQGGSAGGLLMGAVANMAPKLWNGIIADVPFVDVVNTMLDESIPLTTNEFDEWGNPKNKESYFYMKSYSPYENVEHKEYPNMLVTTGLHDSQVQYFEPAKWVAKLRDMKTDRNVLLLHTNMEFGHGGASGRFDYLKDIAMSYAFLFKLEGIEE